MVSGMKNNTSEGFHNEVFDGIFEERFQNPSHVRLKTCESLFLKEL